MPAPLTPAPTITQPTNTDPVLSHAPRTGGATAAPIPGLDFTVTLQPMPNKDKVDAAAFLSALSQILGTPAANIIMTTGADAGNNTLVVTISFLDDRVRLQDALGNMTQPDKITLGIVKMYSAPSSSGEAAAPEKDTNFLFVFIALGFLAAFLVLAWFGWRKMSERVKQSRDGGSGIDLESMRRQMMAEFDGADEMLPGTYESKGPRKRDYDQL